MVLEIDTPTVDDAETLASILWDAHETSPIMRRLLHDAPYDEKVAAELRQWTSSRFRRVWDYGPRRVARDSETGAIVASMAYDFVPTSHSEALAQKPKNKYEESAPAGVDAQVLSELDLSDWDSRVKAMGAAQFIYLKSLATLPGHQRRGAGRMLVNHVIAEADRRNLPLFVVSSPDGQKLYKSCGFEPLGQAPIDMSSIGEPPYIHTPMQKPAPRPDEPGDFPELPRRPVKVLPMEKTEADLEQMVAIGKRAFGPDPLIDFCFQFSETKEDPGEKPTDRHMQRIQNPKFTYYKAIDEDKPDGPIIGTAMWYTIEKPTEEADDSPWGPAPPGSHVECIEASMGELRRWRNDHFRKDDKPYIYMVALTVEPDAQRRGIGASLLREGLKEADAKGLPAFIEASPSGLELYKRFGWEEVITNVVNLKDFGGDDLEAITIGLIRPPGAKEWAKPLPKSAPTDLEA